MASYPPINDKYAEWWRGGDSPGNAADQMSRNRPSVRVLLILSPSMFKVAYPKGVSGIQFGTGTFIKANKTTKIDITNFITDLTFGDGDDNAYVDCSITLDNREELFSKLPIGAMIVIERRKPIWSAKGKFYPLLNVFIWGKDKSLDASASTMSITCYDRMFWLSKFDLPNKVYKKDKAHKHGWTTYQLIAALAREARVPLGVIAASLKRSKAKHTRFETTGTFLDTLTKLLAADKKKTNRKNKPVIHARNGRLNITIPADPAKQLAKTKYIPMFHDTVSIESGSVRQSMKEDEFATRLLLRQSSADQKKNKKKRKHKVIKAKEIVVNPTDPNVQRVFGVIAREDFKIRKRDLPLAGIKRAGQTELNKRLRPDTEIEFTTRGYPNLWPGDFILVVSPKIGVRGFFRVHNISYNLSNGQLLMSIIIKPEGKIKANFSKFEIPSLKAHIRY